MRDLYKGMNYPQSYAFFEPFTWFAFSVQNATPYAAFHRYDESGVDAISLDFQPTIVRYTCVDEPNVLVVTPQNAQQYTTGNRGGVVRTPSRGFVRRKDYDWDRWFVNDLFTRYNIDAVQFSGFTDDMGFSWHDEICFRSPASFLRPIQSVTIDPAERTRAKILSRYEPIACADAPPCADDWNKVYVIEGLAEQRGVYGLVDSRVLSRYACAHKEANVIRYVFEPYKYKDLATDFMLRFGAQK